MGYSLEMRDLMKMSSPHTGEVLRFWKKLAIASNADVECRSHFEAISPRRGFIWAKALNVVLSSVNTVLPALAMFN